VDEQTTCEIVDWTVAHNEPDLMTEREIVTTEFRDKLLPMIVGFKIEIQQLEGKMKLGQQRSKKDQQGVLHWLSASQDHSSRALAQYMRKVRTGTGE
jgi:transcriptional regulator